MNKLLLNGLKKGGNPIFAYANLRYFGVQMSKAKMGMIFQNYRENFFHLYAHFIPLE